MVALATTEFAATLVQRNPDGSLPPQTPELLAKLVPPMFGALQRALAPLLPDGKLQEPGFVQVTICYLVIYVLYVLCLLFAITFSARAKDCLCRWVAPLLPDGKLQEPGFVQVGGVTNLIKHAISCPVGRCMTRLPEG